MGRLFWKFFFATWLVQALAVSAIGTGIWFKDRNAARRDAQVDFGPPAAFMVDAAAQTLRYGGMDALRALLGQRGGPTVYAIDDDGRDLLGRPASDTLVRQLRKLNADDPAARTLQRVAVDGKSWLLFASRPQRGTGQQAAGPND
ncbi:MAG TPA: two-component sensor histidine kinase, partial [Telluria sp.]|nr:two-component sensor histidine kinase [Telluria sp.]